MAGQETSGGIEPEKQPIFPLRHEADSVDCIPQGGVLNDGDEDHSIELVDADTDIAERDSIPNDGETVVRQVASADDDIEKSILNANPMSECQLTRAPTNDDQPISDRQRVACLALFFLLLIILVVPLSLMRGTRKSENRRDSNAATMPSQSPMKWSLPPTTDRFSDIRQEVRVQFDSPTLEEDLLNPNSPQYRAILWMAEEDQHPTTASLSYPLNQTDLEVLQFRQRYALVTLFYSTGDEKWKDPCNFLTPSLHVCDWRCTWSLTDTIVADSGGIYWFSTDYMGVNCGSHLNESNPVLVDLVVSLEIANNNLIGTIPHEIQGLDVLKILILDNSWLRGTVPFDALAKTMIVKRPLFADQVGLVDPILPSLHEDSRIFPSVQWISVLHNQMTGTISSTVGLLGAIKWLYLSENQFTGTIPSEIFGLSELRMLDFHRNQLSGNLPWSLRNLTTLEALYLDDNLFSGWLPTGLGHLTPLTDLDIRTNVFTGTLPSSLGQLTALERCYLDDNLFSGGLPSSLRQLTSLMVLSVSKNGFTGKLPSLLEDLTDLQYLLLFENMFSGGLPSSLGRLTALNVVDVAKNSLSGILPSSLGNLTDLRYLLLNDNMFSGELPSSLQRLTALVNLHVSFNDFVGKLPSGLGHLTALTVLDVHTNGLTGTLPSSLGNLTDLEYLLLNENMFSGGLPSSLQQLTALIVLSVSTNGLTGMLPLSLGQLTALTYLNVSMNDFVGELPSSLGNLSDLQHLILNDNVFSGELPSSLGQLTALTSLIVSMNRFTGKFMEKALLYKLTALQVLVLDGNLFSGTIPADIGLLQALTLFSDVVPWSANHSDPVSAEVRQLSGTIPTTVGLLTKLNRLELGGNQLTGSIPTEIANLGETLTYLSLSNNNLSGLLPTELGSLSNLGTLKLFGNALIGSLEPFCSVNPVFDINGEFSADCLVDTVICSCCTVCCEEDGDTCVDLTFVS